MEEDHSILLRSFLALFLLMSESSAVDTLSANIALKDGDTVVSENGMFELGFFSPINTNNRYLGIWYKKISNGTVVWVANRETPLTDKSGMFKLSYYGSLQLKIINGRKTEIWSSSSSMVSVKNLNPVMQLFDNGNLVVWDNNEKGSAVRNLIWQSFDYPGNTLLPGMKFGKDFVTGIDRYLTSWKSPDDPSPGQHMYFIDTNGYPQIFERQGSVTQLRIGPWNGVKFHGRPIDEPNPMYASEFIFNQKEVYYKYELKTSVVLIVVLRSDGSTVQLQWSERIRDWVMFGNVAIDNCGSYGICGAYAVCTINRYPPCNCIEGFVPIEKEEWNAADWSRGCQLKQPWGCGDGDTGFKKLAGMKFPDTRRSWYNIHISLGECEMACRMNCSCSAYANLDVRKGGSGCLLWFGELMDIREYDEDQSIYIRMAASELVEQGHKNQSVLAEAIAISSAALLLMSAAAYAYRYKKKRRMRFRAHTLDKRDTDALTEDLDELPFFSLNEIIKATDNFSINNKIGEGGFGPVYKGVLANGQEIAVKRLSETSQQGLDEFKNEVICIAKFQHRNLVKLLGYCIHGIEMILIYEYMVNKSLDSFIFDDTNSSKLDWAHRFRIIHGMARGILYLHQDSRFQIIHRDLKASNILLDVDMHPKISDFGLARKFVGFDNTSRTNKVVGTYGYISPEYAVHGRFSTKSDVFSFGVLVLEIVSGKKNKEFSHADHRDNLLGHAWRLFKENKSMELMCASLHNSYVISEVMRAIHVGLLCVQHHAEDRPTMLSAVLMLVGEGPLPSPKQPAFFTAESRRDLDKGSSGSDYMITQVHAR